MHDRPRALLTAMFDAAVAAADPMRCVPRHLPRDGPIPCPTGRERWRPSIFSMRWRV